MSEVEKVVSAGGVIYRADTDGFKVALILNDDFWCLPKGLTEEGETLEVTASREVREETGLMGELVDKIGEISYSFFRKKRYLKTVHFYLFKFIGGSVDAHDSEVDEARWFSIPDALNALVYPNEKKMLLKAEKMLKG